LQLIDAWEDNRRVSNWAAAIQHVTNSPTTAVAVGSSWRYWQNASAPSVIWNSLNFSDASWPNGSALFFVESSALPAAKATPLTLGPTTFYFRTRFTNTDNPTGAVLRLRPVIDDGAIFYLNGDEIFRLGMPAGAVSHGTFANRVTGNAEFEGPFEVPATGLRQGENVLAVEVHQANADSSDVVFGAELQLLTTRLVNATPGAVNSVLQDMASIPPIWINEVHPINTTGITDGAGERGPWLELFNDSAALVDLSEWSLSDSASALRKSVFPLGTIIPAKGYLLVWADGALTTSPGEIHANFQLSSTGGAVYLSQWRNGITAIADYLQYSSVANQSFGAGIDGQPINRTLLMQSTPGTPNVANPPVGVTLELTHTSSSGVILSWSTVQGKMYVVEAATNLVSGQWEMVQQFAGSGATMTITDNSVPTRAARYFRVRME